jgi:hypothetical protein
MKPHGHPEQADPAGTGTGPDPAPGPVVAPPLHPTPTAGPPRRSRTLSSINGEAPPSLAARWMA